MWLMSFVFPRFIMCENNASFIVLVPHGEAYIYIERESCYSHITKFSIILCYI